MPRLISVSVRRSSPRLSCGCRRVDGGEQPVRRLSYRRQIPTLPGQVQLQNRKHDLQASAPVCGYRRGPLDGQRKLPFCLLQRYPG